MEYDKTYEDLFVQKELNNNLIKLHGSTIRNGIPLYKWALTESSLLGIFYDTNLVLFNGIVKKLEENHEIILKNLEQDNIEQEYFIILTNFTNVAIEKVLF